MRCPHCGHHNDADAASCAQCRRELVPRCVQCGAELGRHGKFCPQCGARVEGADTLSEPASSSGLASAAERRQLTVLFCDLVESTHLAAGMDPEDWRDLIRTYQETAAEVVAFYGGHVAQYLGDGLVTYFGWPLSYEDAPERAVHAGLRIADSVQGRDPRLQVRVGIHTGPVVVGQLGSGDRSETLAVGEVPNVAARVQGLAAPGTVLITAATHRLVAGLFVFEAQPPQPLKGVSEPMALYRVLQPSGVRWREAHSRTPFVGRQRERRLLRDRFEQVRRGDGQMVLITGEAGVGKSRLAYALHDDLTETPHTWIETRGVPYFANTPFYAVTELAREFAQPAPTQVALLAQALEAAGLDVNEALPLMAPLLNLPVPAGYLPVLMAPEVAHQRLVTIVGRLVLGMARVQPTVVLVDDLHWVDSSTLEVLHRLADEGSAAPLLLLGTARPEFQPPWTPRAHHTVLALNRLDAADTRAMVLQVAGAALPDAVVDAVVARTDGVPLFVEELSKAVLEAGARAVREIPPTLQDSLMARLDRLGPAKELAQIGAVLGREFSYALLRAVHPIVPDQLEAALRRLTDAELVYERGRPPEATYMFKHVLVQDAAYASLLKSRRRELHRRVAAALREQLPALLEARPELLAHHYGEAGEVESAATAWQRAGERAIERGAHEAAAGYLQRGLALLGMLPEGRERDEQEFQLQRLLGQAQVVARGYASPEAAAAYARARELGERVAEPVQLAMLLMGFWVSAITRYGPTVAGPLAEQVLAAAERSEFPPLLVWALTAQGITCYHAGELAAARDYFARALVIDDERTAFLAPVDARTSALSYAALTAWQLGLADQARRHAREAVERAAASPRATERAVTGHIAAMLYALLREPAQVLAYADRALAACAEEPNPIHEAMAMMLRGWALAEQGRVEEGLAVLHAGRDRFLATGQRLGLQRQFGLLADAHARAGHFTEALATLAAVEGACPGEEIHRCETLRRRGELLLKLENAEYRMVNGKLRFPPHPSFSVRHSAEAEDCFREALAVARQQDAQFCALRVAISYARLWQERGKRHEARALLAPIFARFTEGFDTVDLREAKSLLEELTP